MVKGEQMKSGGPTGHSIGYIRHGKWTEVCLKRQSIEADWALAKTLGLKKRFVLVAAHAKGYYGYPRQEPADGDVIDGVISRNPSKLCFFDCGTSLSREEIERIDYLNGCGVGSDEYIEFLDRCGAGLFYESSVFRYVSFLVRDWNKAVRILQAGLTRLVAGSGIDAEVAFSQGRMTNLLRVLDADSVYRPEDTGFDGQTVSLVQWQDIMKPLCKRRSVSADESTFSVGEWLEVPTPEDLYIKIDNRGQWAVKTAIAMAIGFPSLVLLILLYELIRKWLF